VKFLIDNQLSRALSEFFRVRGLDCRHVVDVGLGSASDLDICRYARSEGRTIISKDEDFFYIASQPSSAIALIWVRLGNCRTKALIASFEQLWPRIERALNAGDVVIEIR